MTITTAPPTASSGPARPGDWPLFAFDIDMNSTNRRHAKSANTSDFCSDGTYLSNRSSYFVSLSRACL